jgi:AraC-like DNA-binding protein
MDFRNFVSRYNKEIIIKAVNFLPATPLLSTNLHSHFNMVHMTYVKNGCGTCRIEGKIWNLIPGTMHFVMPGEIHQYVADAKKPYQIYFIHLNWYGAIPEEFPRHLHIPFRERTFFNKHLKELSEIFHSASDAVSDFKTYGLFSLLIADILKFSRATKAVSLKSYIPINSQEARLNYVFEQLYGPPFKSPNIDFLIEHYRVSRRKFTALFKKLTGMTVKQYYLRNVMTYASAMMGNKEFKLKDIAVQCGYSNSQNFLHAYKIYAKKQEK